METRVELTDKPIARPEQSPVDGRLGAWIEFAGIVREEEAGEQIAALEYEAYESMATKILADLLSELGSRHRCLTAHVIHRIGVVPVGEAAIWIGVGAGHRREALAFVSEFMDQLKQEVPIWKRRAIAG